MSKKKYIDILNPKINNDIFTNIIDTFLISLSILQIDKDIDKTFLNIIKQKLEGKCNKNGLIKKDSINIITYTSGVIKGEDINYTVTYSCDICNPVNGMNIECYIKNITKAGIRAELNGYQNSDEKSPIVLFIARDHNYNNSTFINLKENDIINCKIIGSRFVLNDEFISCIGEII
tara:strand:+ start:11469 stop:11996 length:528 start_codon:yes stop_codon:yes gene_type:complete